MPKLLWINLLNYLCLLFFGISGLFSIRNGCGFQYLMFNVATFAMPTDDHVNA